MWLNDISTLPTGTAADVAEVEGAGMTVGLLSMVETAAVEEEQEETAEQSEVEAEAEALVLL